MTEPLIRKGQSLILEGGQKLLFTRSDENAGQTRYHFHNGFDVGHAFLKLKLDKGDWHIGGIE